MFGIHGTDTTATTNADGYAEFCGLKAGDYTIDEVTPPAGYDAAPSQDVTLPGDCVAPSTDQQAACTVLLTFEDSLTPTPTPTATPTTQPEVTPTPTPTVEPATGTPNITPPPTDTFGGPSSPSGDSWRLVVLAMAGALASLLVLTPATRKRR